MPVPATLEKASQTHRPSSTFIQTKKKSHLGGETISNKNDSVNLFEKSVDMVSNVEKRSFAEEEKIVSIELFESGENSNKNALIKCYLCETEHSMETILSHITDCR